MRGDEIWGEQSGGLTARVRRGGGWPSQRRVRVPPLLTGEKCRAQRVRFGAVEIVVRLKVEQGGREEEGFAVRVQLLSRHSNAGRQ